MPKKLVSAFLVFAVALVTVAPRRTFGQATAPPATSTIESEPSAQPATSRADLRRALAAEVAKVKAGTLTTEDLKRLEKEQQVANSPKPDFTRKQKMFLALWIVVMTGVVVVLIKHACKDPKPCPEPDPTQDSSY